MLYGFAYAQPKVVTFESEENSTEESTYSKRNLLKVGVVELFSGDFPIYYERVLTNHISAEIGLGITFGDFYSDVVNLGGGDGGSSPLNTNVDARYGVSFSAALRFYPIEILEELYISTEFKFRKFNWGRQIDEIYYDPEDIDPPVEISENVTESRTYSMPRVTLGYSYFYEENLIIDLHVGIGMNTSVDEIFDYQSKQVIKTERPTNPRVHAGVKISYVF